MPFSHTTVGTGATPLRWLALVVLALFPAAGRSSILRVKPDSPGPAHDGASWQTAYHTVQEASAVAATYDEIWVAEGTYTGPYVFRYGTLVFGGFVGTETQRDQRDPSIHSSILGHLDYSGFSSATPAQPGLYTVLNGLRLQEGFVSGPTPTHVVFSGCSFLSGGVNLTPGSGCPVTVTACSFPSGTVLSVSSTASGLIIVATNQFTDCMVSIARGGGDVHFDDNLLVETRPTISGPCHAFVRRNSFLRGGIAVLVDGGFSIDRNVLSLGNGIETSNDGVVSNSVLNGCSLRASAMVTGSIVGNTIVGSPGGPGITVDGGAPTLASNIVTQCYRGITVLSGAPRIWNNCVFDNSPANYAGVPDQTWSNGNISMDPMFRPPGDYHISPFSPCRDTGYNAAVSDFLDVDGEPRVADGTVDMGADECQQVPRVVRVWAGAHGPGHDGTSWEAAYLTLQDAAADAGRGDEFWMAGGTYTGPFALPQTVAYYGGFAGTETERAQRDPDAVTTVLTGGDCTLAPLWPLKPSLTTVFDGMSVLNCPLNWVGHARMELADCRFDGSPVASRGAGPGLPFFVTDCRFENAGVSAPDAAMALDQSILNTYVARNTFSGGGINVSQNITRILIEDNAISDGGVSVTGDTWGTIRRNAVSGGRISANCAVECIVESNTVTGGSAAQGGGIWAYGDHLMRIAGNTVKDCHATEQGGGLYVSGTFPQVLNNIAFRCAAPEGGGIYLGGPQPILSPSITGNTLVGNVAASGAGLLIGVTYGDGLYANNIVAFNDGPGITLTAGGLGARDFRNNCVFGNASNYSGIADQTGLNGNIAADPLLADRLRGDNHIQPASPCRDTGNDAYAFGVDIDGQARVQGAHVDIGADESDGTTGTRAPYVLKVATTGNDFSDGLTWATALKTVSAAVALGTVGDEAWVASGRYADKPTLKGIALYGGFQGSETERSQRNPASFISLLDNGADTQGPSSTIDGFSSFGNIACNGEGMLLNNTYLRASLTGAAFSSIDVRKCRVVGGGISAPLASWLSVQDCEITDSPARGIETLGDVGVLIARNKLLRCREGGVYLHTSGRPIIENNTITDCKATEGAGIWCGGEDLLARNNLLARNTATDRGGAVLVSTRGYTLSGNTMVANVASVGAGVAIQQGEPSIPGTLANNIIAFNTIGVWRGSGPDPLMYSNDVYGSIAFDYVGVSDPTGTNGNISADPLLVDRVNWNYHLTAGSPCVNAGSNAQSSGAADYEGDARVFGGTVDIGADEYVPAQYSLEDVVRSLRVAAGLVTALSGDLKRLNLVKSGASAGVVGLEDAVLAARKVGGVEPNP